jgi:hypothetical protein
MDKIGWTLLSLLVVALVLGVGTATAQNTPPDYDYDVGYFANANAAGAPSAHLRLTNDGSFEDAINLCANIYVFDPMGTSTSPSTRTSLATSWIMAQSPPGASSKSFRVLFLLQRISAPLPSLTPFLELKAGSLTFRRVQPRARSASPRRL